MYIISYKVRIGKSILSIVYRFESGTIMNTTLQSYLATFLVIVIYDLRSFIPKIGH